MLHDYVPFYFAERSPMLYTINRGNVEGYDGGQEPIVYLVSRINTIREHNRPFVFSDGHGTKAFTQFFADLADLSNVDWAIMKEKYWLDTDEDGDRKRRRQAEFLIHRECPWSAIRGLVVINASMQDSVGELRAGCEYLRERRFVRLSQNPWCQMINNPNDISCRGGAEMLEMRFLQSNIAR